MTSRTRKGKGRWVRVNHEKYTDMWFAGFKVRVTKQKLVHGTYKKYEFWRPLTRGTRGKGK